MQDCIYLQFLFFNATFVIYLMQTIFDIIQQKEIKILKWYLLVAVLTLITVIMIKMKNPLFPMVFIISLEI